MSKLVMRGGDVEANNIKASNANETLQSAKKGRNGRSNPLAWLKRGRLPWTKKKGRVCHVENPKQKQHGPGRGGGGCSTGSWGPTGKIVGTGVVLQRQLPP